MVQVGPCTNRDIEHGDVVSPLQTAHQLGTQLVDSPAIFKPPHPFLSKIVNVRHPIVHLHVLVVIPTNKVVIHIHEDAALLF